MEPTFPYSAGPRQYQINAYKKWIKNKQKGVFAMATGSGKTITALNCLLENYKEDGFYRAIILVPSIPLLDQWKLEVKKFSYNDILIAGGGNDWERDFASYVSKYSWGNRQNLIIVCTYGTFITDKFQKYFNKVGEDFMLIADEAHNMASKSIRQVLPQIKSKRLIGLSATPKRIYDVEGTEVLNSFFDDAPPYTYEFSIKEAINEGFLSEYKYYPKVVELNQAEMHDYIDISKRLLKFFDFEKGEFRNDPIVEILMLKRKNIIHKAQNKIIQFKEILSEIVQNRKLKYAFTFVPEGLDSNNVRLIDLYIKAGAETIPELKMNSYTSEDDSPSEILRGFTDGKIDMLYAMKMLDEGIDIPRAEIGIFCSSTGNPRQFIQRRGRLLRKHPEKSYALIYDMIVVPNTAIKTSEYFAMERNLVKKELQRVAHFASLSMNFYDSKRNLEFVLEKYDLNMDQIISEL